MNQIAGRGARKIPHILTLTAFAAIFALAGPSSVFAEDITPAGPSSSHARHVSARATSAEETADDRIKYLHKVLQITPSQEDQWNKVATVIRENAEQITSLAKTRSENYKSMTAVDDLKSYAEFSSAHEDGTRKLIPVFQALYESMTEPQQKVADMVFRDHGRKGHTVAKS